MSRVIFTWVRCNVVALSTTFFVSLFVYNAFATGIVLTNHTFPNSFEYNYPSYKTALEGRWLADILINVFGGGSQVFQALVGFATQALNGVLFAELLRVDGWGRRTLVALIVALHPVVLDYYSFSADNLGFTLGDGLIILGVMALDRLTAKVAVPVAALCLLASLAIYQPKVGVIATVLGAWLITSTIRDGFHWRRAAAAFIASIAGITGYYLTALATISMTGQPERTNLNGLREIARQLFTSFSTVGDQVDGIARNLPLLGTIGVYATILGGLAAFLWMASRRGPATLFWVAVILLAMPIAVRFSFIINSEGWPFEGRLVIGHAYLFALLAVGLLMLRSSAIGGLIAIGLAAYGFAFVALQESSYLSLKTIYEQDLIGRVVGRIEEIAGVGAPHPIVVIGASPNSQLDQAVRFPSRPFRPQASKPTYIFWRQPEVTNFFAGSLLVTFPTSADVASVLAVAEDHPLWPSPGSVFRVGNVIAVNFARFSDGVEVTAVPE